MQISRFVCFIFGCAVRTLVIVMSETGKKSLLLFEIVGMVFIIMLGSILHFTFEWGGRQPIVGIFSAVNESVWEHLKLAFWPALLYAIMEYRYVRKSASNFWFAKAVGIYVMPIAIATMFYSYMAIAQEDIFALDIMAFIAAVIIGQLVSYKLVTYKKLPDYLGKTALVTLVILALAFALFTYYPPQLPLFKDPITGEYGITNH